MSRAYVETSGIGGTYVDREVMVTYRRMKRDLEAAARIQRSLLPQASPLIDGLRVTWNLIPCDELAGDSLNFVRLDERRLGVYILDVSGHGLEAALLAVTLHKVLAALAGGLSTQLQSANARPIVSPSELANELNHIFPQDPETSQYFTLLYGIVDLRLRSFRYVTAGHHAPVYLPPNGRAHAEENGGFPIGVVADAEYQEHVIELEPGSRLFLYSDGMIDAECFYEGPFGKRRLIQSIERTRRRPLHDSATYLIERVRDWSSTARLEDDASLLAIEID
jgi:sigma-B regulation protein RsbU (phosphoserine phosphatase)